MPLPTPNSDEGKNEFMNRCMQQIANEFNDPKQRFAVCSTQWDQQNTRSKAMRIDKVYKVEKDNINDENQAITFIISTEDIDSDYDRIMADGWNFDRVGGYIPFLPFHDRKQWPLGHFTKIWVDSDKVYGTVRFATEEENPEGARAFKMYKSGHARAVSVGFDALEYEPNEYGGYDVKSSVLHEVSAVTVGANPKATAIRKAIAQKNWKQADEDNIQEALGILNGKKARVDTIIDLMGEFDDDVLNEVLGLIEADIEANDLLLNLLGIEEDTAPATQEGKQPDEPEGEQSKAELRQLLDAILEVKTKIEQ